MRERNTEPDWNCTDCGAELVMLCMMAVFEEHPDLCRCYCPVCDTGFYLAGELEKTYHEYKWPGALADLEKRACFPEIQERGLSKERESLVFAEEIRHWESTTER